MSEYYISEILTVLLTIYGLFHMENPFYLLCTSGLLMVVFTMESLCEKRNVILTILKILLMTLCCLSNGFLFFLIFGQVGFKKTNSILPPVLFIIFQIIINGDTFNSFLPIVIVKVAVLLCLSLAIWHLEKIAAQYMDYKHQIEISMRGLAINELAERKLNRELVIRNNIIERNARLEERENISRNIHNSVGHTITAAIMALDAAELLWKVDSDRAIDKVKTANERIHTSLDSIRRAVRVLDEETVNVSMEDFRMEISEIIDNFVMDTDIKISLDADATDSDLMIPHEHTEFLTGAIEELLTNGVKHGRADRFTVGILADSSHLKITVLDNGHSDFCEENYINRIQDGFGLKKIIRYVQNNGGTAVFKNENGFRAEIMIQIN